MLEGNCGHEGVHLPSSGGARLGKEGFRLVEDCLQTRSCAGRQGGGSFTMQRWESGLGGGVVTESSEVSQSPHMSRDAAKGAHHSDCCCPDKEERVHALPHVMVLPPLPL